MSSVNPANTIHFFFNPIVDQPADPKTSTEEKASAVFVEAVRIFSVKSDLRKWVQTERFLKDGSRKSFKFDASLLDVPGQVIFEFDFYQGVQVGSIVMSAADLKNYSMNTCAFNIRLRRSSPQKDAQPTITLQLSNPTAKNQNPFQSEGKDQPHYIGGESFGFFHHAPFFLTEAMCQRDLSDSERSKGEWVMVEAPARDDDIGCGWVDVAKLEGVNDET